MSVFDVPNMFEKLWLAPLRIVWACGVVVLRLIRNIVVTVTYCLSRPLKPVVDVVNLVCTWAGDNPSRKWVMIIIGSLAVSFLSILPFVGSRVDIAVAFFLSIYIHEQFHGFGYKRVNIPYFMVFIFFLGAAIVVTDERYRNMKSWDKSLMLLLGPLGSLLTAIFWLVLARIDTVNAHTYMMLGGFNLTLVLLNMIALGALDGGRIYLSVMSSLKEDKEKYVALVMVLVSVIVLGHVFWQSFRFELILFFLLLMVIGFLKTAGKDNPADYLKAESMNWKEEIVILVLYVVIFMVAAILYPYFPDWARLIQIDPFIATHIAEIGIFLFNVSVFVVAADIVIWTEKRTKFRTQIEVVALLPLFLCLIVSPFVLYQTGASILSVIVVTVSGVLIGHFSYKVVLKWRAVHSEIVSKIKEEPILDLHYVSADGA